MPPDGFDTVTLPVELIDELDRVAAEVSPDPSRPAAVRRLIDAYDTSESDGDGLPDAVRDQLDRIESSAKTAERRANRIENTAEMIREALR
jgi:hypothetical protein